MENNSPLVNLSLLECLKGEKYRDELDLYMPFLANILIELGTDVIDKELLQATFQDKFKINIPLTALNSILVRAKKNNFLRKKNGCLFIQHDVIKQISDQNKSKKEEIQQSVNLISESFIDFAKLHFDQTLDFEFAESSLYDFIRANISIFADSIGKDKPQKKAKIKNKDYLMAMFIKYIHDEKKSLIPEISKIVKGTLLANYLTFADKTVQKKKFTNISVYLDTPIIMGLLGWDGPKRENSLKELIDLLIDLKVNIHVFDVTLREIKAVLNNWARSLELKKYENIHEKTRQLFESRGTRPEHIETEIALLESNLVNLGISLVDNYTLNPKFCCDEEKLEKYLRRIFKSNNSRVHDTQCVAMVYNSREGKTVSSLNKTFSIFISSNKYLAEVTTRFFKNDIEPNSIQLVASEKWLATFLWLKHPENFKNLPFDLLLTEAYSALNTDDRFWNGFLRRLKDLKSKGEISEEDFNTVRWNSSTFSMAQKASVLGGDEIPDEDIYEIVANVKAKEHEKINETVKKQENKIIALSGSIDGMSTNIRKFFNPVSHIIALITTLVYSILWIIGTYFYGPQLFTSSVSKFDSSSYKYLIYLSFLMITVIAIFSAFKMGIKLYKFCQTKVYDKFIHKFIN